MHNLICNFDYCGCFIKSRLISRYFRADRIVNSSRDSFRKHVAVTLIDGSIWVRWVLALYGSKFIVRNNKVLITTEWVRRVWFRIFFVWDLFQLHSVRFSLTLKCLLTSQCTNKTTLTLCGSNLFYFLLCCNFFIVVKLIDVIKLRIFVDIGL